MSRPLPPRPRLLAITWPILAEQVLHMLVGLLGVWLVSRISDDSAAAYSLSNQIMLAFMITFRFVSLGASVVVTQYLGAGDHAGADRVARAAVGANAWMGFGSCLIIAVAAVPLLHLMQTPEQLLPVARPYLMLVGVSLLFDAINFSLGAVLRAHMHTLQTLKLIGVMYVAQLALGLPLMFGFGPIPALGMEGLALGAIGARLLSLAMHMQLFKRLLNLRLTWPDFWRIHMRPVREMLHIGLPGAGEQVAYRTSFMTILAMVAGMGPAAISTHVYTMQVVQFLLVFGLALGFGTEIVVGHRVGAGELHGANRQVMRGLTIGLPMALIVSFCAALAGPHLLSIFTSNPGIIATGSHLLWLSMLVETGRVFNMVVINGLRATGDARFPVGAGVISMFAVAVGLSWLLGVHMGWGLAGVWVAYAADEWTRGITMFLRWRWHGWVPHARKTRRRVRVKPA